MVVQVAPHCPPVGLIGQHQLLRASQVTSAAAARRVV